MNIVSLVSLSAENERRIRATDARVSLHTAPGWFDGEIARSWPAATVQRYVKGEGQGTQAERNDLLARADVVLTGFPYPLDLRARAPRLAWLHQTPAGASNLRRGDLWNSDVVVTTSRGFGDTVAIAEYAVAGIAHFAKSFDQALRDRDGNHFDHTRYRSLSLRGSTLCVIGAGGIGREVAKLAAALGMRVIGTRRNPARTDDDAPFDTIESPDRLHDQLAQSDAVAVCCQWTPATTDLLDRAAFAAMKPGAIVVNVARGEIVNETALLDALNNDQLRGAVLDVYVGEFEHPPPPALWQHPKVLVTPHTSSMSDRSRHRGVETFLDNLQRFLADKPLINIVDWSAGY